MPNGNAGTPNVTIPTYLGAEVQDGKTVLVLGAGATQGAVHPQKQKPPSGGDLARLVADKFLGGAHGDASLASVADMAIAASDLRTVQRFIADYLRPFGPGDHHLLLPKFRWYGLATLNYDEVVEKAYEQNKVKLNVIRSNTDPIEDAIRDTTGTTLLKLHGCITRAEDDALPLILTPAQYADHRQGRERLFNTLRSWGAERTIVFCGTTIDDSDIHQLLREILSDMKSHPHYYTC